ncbi:stage V sporulation protein E [Opitutales bacterium ASA1]|uniref:FtsW/RodA/SpoVE family cell cycle protein n=1 Tax=Congregicoccus parvus TaxID=3081749 RepID=UPI002B321C95|nr:stage V sporulation protein E [Opitutales bacterium ASA1]
MKDTEKPTKTPTETTRHARLEVFFNPASFILAAAIGLTLLGITILFSASMSYRTDPYFFVRKQVTWLGVALVVGFVAARVNLEKLRGLSWWIVGVLFAGLVLVLVPGIGVEVNGARRWFDVGPGRLQISEFAKLGMVFVLAHYLARNHKDIGTFGRGFLYPLAGLGVVCFLILLQPDFGTAMLTGAVGAIMLMLAGTRLIFLVPSVLAGAAAIGVAIYFDPVRMSRITSFLDVEGNRAEGSYQLWQAILAFGAGGVQGVGLGSGRQQMAFLPEAHTDFIFAIVGEELGLPFTLGVVCVFALVFLAGVLHLRRAPNVFQFLLVTGSLLLMTLQAVINLGVVTGLLPTKGMSLPFISYGGSNLLLMAMIVGLMLNTRTAWARPVLRDRDREWKEVAA